MRWIADTGVDEQWLGAVDEPRVVAGRPGKGTWVAGRYQADHRPK
jgi:hypothetical protein